MCSFCAEMMYIFHFSTVVEEEDKSWFKGAMFLTHDSYLIFLFYSIPFDLQDWLLESRISRNPRAEKCILWTA